MQLAAILIIVVTVPVALLGFLLINTSHEAVKSSVLRNHKQIAIRAANEIELFIKGPEDILKTTAEMLELIYPATWKLETFISELILNQPVFINVAVMNLSGEVMAGSEPGAWLGKSRGLEALNDAGSGRDYMSSVRMLDNHTPYLTMAVPVRKLGKIVGALVADVNLRGIWKTVDNIKLGATGRVFLVSNKGILIAHQDKKLVLRNENFSNNIDVQAALAGNSRSTELRDASGKAWISSYAPVASLGWGLVLRQSKDEAYSFSRVMNTQSWIIVILAELIAIIAAVFISRALVRPINIMASRIRNVAEGGDLGHEIDIRRCDEIGVLIRSYNSMTKKLKKAKSRERLSAIGEAVSWIAHEFKNSLVPIKSFVQLFPRRYKEKEFVDKFNRLMPDEVSRLEHILKEMGDFSSCSGLSMERIDIVEFVKNILEGMEEGFVEKNINARCCPEQAGIYINADSERLKQVLTNLFINAVNAMPGGGLLIVSLGLMNIGKFDGVSKMEIRIKDTGVGIPKDALKYIFEPFHSIRRGGMGLGLAISRRIVEQHGGYITAESEAGAGTTVIIRLPLVTEEIKTVRGGV